MCIILTVISAPHSIRLGVADTLGPGVLQAALEELDGAFLKRVSINPSVVLEKRGDAKRMLGDFQVSCWPRSVSM